jgi:hypothetical protein
MSDEFDWGEEDKREAANGDDVR